MTEILQSLLHCDREHSDFTDRNHQVWHSDGAGGVILPSFPHYNFHNQADQTNLFHSYLQTSKGRSLKSVGKEGSDINKRQR